MEHCPRCEKLINDNANYCEHCGVKICGESEFRNDLENPEQVELWWKSVENYAKLLSNKIP